MLPQLGLLTGPRVLRSVSAALAAMALLVALVACGGSDPSVDLGESAVSTRGPTAGPTADALGSETAPGTTLTQTLRDSVTTYAGTGSPRYAGDGGPASEAGMFAPQGLTVDGDGNLFLSTDKRVRRVEAATGIITTVAGSGSSLHIQDGGPALEASLRDPRGIAVDGEGNLYIADHGNGRVRRVDAATGIISTAAGGAVPQAALVPDIGDGGPADHAFLNEPIDVAVGPQGNLYIVSNHRIRKIEFASGVISTVAGNGHRNLTGDGGPAAEATIAEPEGVTIDGNGNIYIADTGNHRVRKVDAATGLMSTLAGVGVFQDRSGGNIIVDYRREGTGAGYEGDGGPAVNAKLRLPTGVAADAEGNLYILDASIRVRKVDAATGVISTYFGVETRTTTGEQGKLGVHTGSIGQIISIAINDRGDVFLADTIKNLVHLVASRTP